MTSPSLENTFTMAENNTYNLKVADIIWVNNNTNLPPRDFAIRLLKRMFYKTSKTFSNNKSIINACIRLTNSNSYLFEKSRRDKDLLDEFLQYTGRNIPHKLKLFKQALLGFTNTNVRIKKRHITEDKHELLHEVNTYLSTTTKKKKEAAKRGSVRKEQAYAKNEHQLQEVKKEIETEYSDLKHMALLECLNDAFKRRKLRAYKLNPGKDFFLQLRLRGLDPDYIEFPLRFMVELPVSIYHELHQQWRKGTSKAQLIEELIKKVSVDECFEDITRNYTILFEHLRKKIKLENRAKVIEEI